MTENNISRSNVYNMDETGVYFEMSRQTTIDKVGAKRVALAKSSASKSRFSVVLTCSAGGDKLNPTIIFKGIGC